MQTIDPVCNTDVKEQEDITAECDSINIVIPDRTSVFIRELKVYEGSMYCDYGWGIGFGFGWLLMIIFWALLILGVVYLIKLIAVRAKKGEKEETALDILKKRYAKGEITKEEFEKMKDDLAKE